MALEWQDPVGHGLLDDRPAAEGRQKSQAYCGHHKKSCNKYMCEATIPTDSTECFHCFLAEVGVEVLLSYTFRGKPYTFRGEQKVLSLLVAGRRDQAFYSYIFVM